MRGIWGLFPYEAMDYKAAQAYLDRRAALVGCTGLDLTSPDILDMLWTTLELKGS